MIGIIASSDSYVRGVFGVEIITAFAARDCYIRAGIVNIVDTSAAFNCGKRTRFTARVGNEVCAISDINVDISIVAVINDRISLRASGD